MRVSELVGLRLRDVYLGTGRHIRVLGNGREKRAAPLTGEVAALLHQWITERGGGPDDPLFPTRQGRPLSRHTVGLLVGKHADAAAVVRASLKGKRVTPTCSATPPPWPGEPTDPLPSDRSPCPYPVADVTGREN